VIYDILKDFKGSQDGRFAEDFVAGTQRDISDYLAPHCPPGSIRKLVELDNKAVITDGAPRRGRPPKREA